MVCKGVECVRHKAKKPQKGSRYANGQKRCQICEVFMLFAGSSCPCCNMKLRTKPRNLKYKNKLREDHESGKTVQYGVNMATSIVKGGKVTKVIVKDGLKQKPPTITIT